MRQRSAVINSVLAVALVAALLVTYFSVRSSDDAKPAASSTATVRKGDVTATVSASGNVAAATDVNIDFASGGGVVTKIFVKTGDVVREGAAIAQIDQTSARQQLASANASLKSARGQYLTTTQGRSAAERRSDNASIKSAEASVSSANVALASARSTYNLDKSQQNAAVDRAESSVTSAENSVADAQDAVDQAQSDLTQANASGDDVAIARARTNLTSAQQQLSSAQSSVASANSSVTTAKEQRDSKLLQDREAINSQEASVASAKRQLESTKASVAASRQPAKAGAIQSAQAAIDSAQVTVDQAEQGLKDTTLRAPVAGTVASLNGKVGESSSSAGGSSSASSSGSGSGSGGTGSSDSSSTSSSSSGFATLTDVHGLQVTAMVAEADIDKVELGQTVDVTFPADSSTATGTVTGIDVTQTVTNDVVEYGVTVALVDGAEDARIGQSSSLSVITGSAQNVLIAPTSALTTAGGTTTAKVRKGGKDRTVTVKIGMVGDSGTEVLSGLSAGDVLVIPTSGSSGGFTFPSGGLGGLGGPS